MNRLALRLYRVGLRLLPGLIREKHGDAMVDLFRRQLERARARSRAAWAAAVLGGLGDLAARAVYERTRTRPSRRRGEPVLATLLQDFRYAVRGLLRAPRFTTLAVLTLALGIGANTALFSVVHGVVLRALPFPDAERVTHLAWDRGGGAPRGYVPAYKFDYWRERTDAFDAMTTWSGTTVEVGEAGSGDALAGLRVPSTFLDVVGYDPILGRGLTEADDRPGAPDVVVIGHTVWRTRYGSDPGVLGRVLELNGTPHTVVGVLPPDFAFPQVPDRDDLLLPLRLRPDPLDESEHWPILARLRPGVDRRSAQGELDRVYGMFRSEHPELMNGTDRAMVLASYQEIFVGETRTTLWILMGATALVLLIACANVAALLLARGSTRRAEFAVRTALGAGRGRIVRQILAESAVLALLAATAGLGLAHLGVRTLLGLYPGRLPRSEWIGLDGTVVGYALVAALATAVVFGLVAAIPALRHGVAATLRDGARGPSKRGRLRQLLLAAESAVALVLLVGAGLLIATLAEVRSVDPGFDAEGVVVASLSGPADGWSSAADAAAAVDEAVDRVRRLPGVAAAAAASTPPLERGLNIPVGIQGRPDDFEGAVEWRAVSPGYLETLGVERVRGRRLRPSDGAGGPPVALVNQAFADRWFPDRDPIGQRIEIGRYRDRYVHPDFDVGGVEVVGVVGDVREISPKVEARRTVLVPMAQVPATLVSTPVLMARTSGRDAVGAIRQELAAMARGGAAPVLRRMDDLLAGSVATERFNALLMTSFAAVALLLTAFGIYGVVSYTVRQRTREIGIRMALGAPRGSVARMVVAQGMVPVAAGLVLGLGVALALGRLLVSLLWGVAPTHPLALGGGALFLTLVALAASWLPVREATAIEPRRSLQPE